MGDLTAGGPKCSDIVSLYIPVLEEAQPGLKGKPQLQYQLY